ncbi:pleckstrin homology-like domain family B member 1 isoform X2 [Planococcus citri]|uniref:pleckstrin homology-like domain family B member 1 isoform X2 n=1 Tax=Planococcus citri TaxID=170843 RepID=UPI0031F7FD3C
MLEADTVVVVNDDDGKNIVGRGVGDIVVNGMCNNSEAVQDSRGGGRIAVEANGRALKVHAGETPHLVSLGSDRFSTAVTLHPIPKGRVTVGSSPSSDIFIYGTGVEEVHCWIENTEGIVTVHPSSENVPIQVDGLKVTQPTRLTQGCMLCLGRSNFFRFNHPQEARYMKSVLPNTRVSIMPNAFHPITNSDDASVSESKISTDSRRSYDSPDSWYEISSGTSSEDLLNTTSSRNDTVLPIAKHISPKVFLPGSSTLNSPASVVLGRHKYSGNVPNTKSRFYNSVTVYEDRIENFRSLGSADSTHSLANGGGVGCVNDRNNNISSKESNGNEDTNSVKFSSCESLSPKQKIVPPSPAFNRNPSYFNSKCSSPTNDYNSFSASPLLFTSSPRFSNGSTTAKIDRNGSLSSPTSSYDSVGSFCENAFRKGDSEMKRKQAHQNRILEQERERVERLRLEEILTACADYEKQAQNDRFNKPQVRIKTNGSLPRDKQCLSPIAKTPESPRNGIVFNFDKNDSTVSNSDHHSEKSSYPNSPRTRIKTVASPKITRKDYSLELLENKLALLNEYELSNSSPATIRRANTTGHVMRNHVTEFNAKNSPKFYHQDRSMNGNGYATSPDRFNDTNSSYNSSYSSIAKNNTLKKYKFLGIDPDAINNASANQDSLPKTDIMSRSYHESFTSATKTTNEDKETNIMSTSLINFDVANNHHNQNELANFSSNDYAKSKSATLLSHHNKSSDDKVDKDDGIEKLNGLVLELNEIVRENEKTKERAASNASKAKFILPLDETLLSSKESKFILPLEEIDIALKRQRFSMKKCELKRLQSEQSRLMDAINNVKTKLLDIQQQKDEIIRELEMEKALLEGELKSENEKLVSEEEHFSNVQEKVNHCEKQIEACSKQQTERQDQNKSVVDEQQNILNVLQSNLSCISNENDKSSIIESIGKSKEILEEETKSFEDFEFRLLEEEAALLSKRDELQSELNKTNNAMEHTRSKISGLYSQKEQLLQNASDEIRSLELQVRCHTRTLQQNHSRLQDISVQLKETSKSLNEISEEAIDSCDETVYSYKTQSQEDLDRISRVTSDAPLMESGSSNSLGRRTIASLQQIERNRQLHLAQQEEERKRMLALKRRVQDEVKAQWEEDKKQRENNCSSITSIGSDNSSVMSSDRVTESPNNEEKSPVKTTIDEEQIEANGSAVQSNMQIAPSGQKDNDEAERSSKHKRPSNASATLENGSVVKLRLSRGDINQRPESRYSAYKRGSLDLRQHIESAGHQLDHCPQVFVDKTSCRGYLQKMTTKFRTWNKRWFVFDRKKCSFTYYSDKSEKKLKGGAYFQGLLDLCIDNTNSIRSPNPQATFIVKSTERVYYLLAPSIEAMRIWFDVLATEVETFQDA